MQVHSFADAPWTFDPQLELKQSRRASTMQSVRECLCVGVFIALLRVLLHSHHPSISTNALRFRCRVLLLQCFTQPFPALSWTLAS